MVYISYVGLLRPVKLGYGNRIPARFSALRGPVSSDV